MADEPVEKRGRHDKKPGKHEKSGKHERRDRERDRREEENGPGDRHKRHKHGRARDDDESSGDGRKRRKHGKGKGKDKERPPRDKHGGRERRAPEEDAAPSDGEEADWPAPDAPPPGGVVLSASDYFARSHEFRAWLLKEQAIFLDELPTTQARKLFRLFGTLWNSGRLPPAYYEQGAAAEASLSAAQRTRHKWAFADKLSEAERLRLDSAKDHVDTLTRRKHADVR